MRYAFALLITAVSASAQAPRSIPAVGDSVRVWAAAPGLEAARGTVRRVADDTVVFTFRSAVSREWLDTPVATRNISRIEVPDGFQRSRKRTAIGYAAGAVLGLAAGGYIAWRVSPLYCNTTPCQTNVSAEEAVWYSSTILVGGITGATMGGAIGWAIGRRPVARWRQVYP